MFEVQLIRTIFDAPSGARSRRLATLMLDISLPFAPFQSLKLRLAGLPAGQISSVVWEQDLRKFRCELLEEYSQWRVWVDVDFDSQLKRLEGDGWKVVLLEDIEGSDDTKA